MTNQVSELAVADGCGISESNSSSEVDSDDEGAVLERAKVEGVDLQLLKVGPDGKAPLELVSQVRMAWVRGYKMYSSFSY